METLKIIIADDEQTARELIVFYLDQSGIKYNAEQVGDGSSALRLLNQSNFDLLFLDIKMPELDGLQVLEKKNPAALPVIIFSTAFDQFALPAFSHNAIDYLLK